MKITVAIKITRDFERGAHKKPKVIYKIWKGGRLSLKQYILFPRKRTWKRNVSANFIRVEKCVCRNEMSSCGFYTYERMSRSRLEIKESIKCFGIERSLRCITKKI